MRARKPILVVTTRPELRFTLRVCNAHVEVFSAESREELKSLISAGFEPVMAVVDTRDMQPKGAAKFVATVRESFAMVKILTIVKSGESSLFGADRYLRDERGLSLALIESVVSMVALPRGPRPVKKPITEVDQAVTALAKGA